MPSQTESTQSRHAVWLCTAILAIACASASLVFACATPFAAFAVLAAAVLPLRPALMVIGAIWLVNQVIGFGILDYPRTMNSALWGIGIGAAALVTTAAAAGVFHKLAHWGRFAIYPVALVACFAVYEVVMLAMTPVLGGIESFALNIVGQLAFVNAIWLVGLIVAFELLSRVSGTVLSGAERQRPL
jgi:hypothetical protein